MATVIDYDPDREVRVLALVAAATGLPFEPHRIERGSITIDVQGYTLAKVTTTVWVTGEAAEKLIAGLRELG